jgi:predicted MFS family arabinose efflux permease
VSGASSGRIEPARDAPPLNRALLLLAVILALGIAHLGTSTMPLQIGALMDGRGLKGREAGLFGFFEVGALAVTMMAISPVIHRFRTVMVAAAGTMIGAAAYLCLYLFSPSLIGLLILGALTGSGYGLVFSASITGVSAMDNPDRVYSIGNGGAVVFVVSIMMLIPVMSAHFGTTGAFLAVAIVLALCTPAMLAFRARAVPPVSAPIRLARDPAVLKLLILWGGYTLGTGALWSFAERIAKSIHLPAETTGMILSATTATGVLGTICAAWAAGRVPRLVTMLIGLGGTGISCLLMGFASGPISYTLGALTYWIFYMFQYPLFLGAAASIDPEGRVGTLGSGCERFCFAIGAPIGGLIADYGSYPTLGILGFIACVGTIPFCLPAVLARLSRDIGTAEQTPRVGGDATALGTIAQPELE